MTTEQAAGSRRNALIGRVRTRWNRPPTKDERDAVDELIPDGDEFWRYLATFTIFTLLSASIAAFGLLANSGAVVIGAMLVAPLMTPITAAGAATVEAHNFRLFRSMAVILWGTILAITVGWAVALLSRASYNTAAELPQEVISRTFPGMLDLGIAISAGLAAGYIAPRRAVTSALPGVGIAVALVPPLATVGITAYLGFSSESSNALLLYLTNLAAIIFSVAIMLIAAGFRPTHQTGRRPLYVRLAITLAAVAVVAVPLSVHTQSSLRDAELRNAVNEAVLEWDDAVRVVEMDASAIADRAEVELLAAGPNTAPPAWLLAELIGDYHGGPVDLRLQYQEDELFEVSTR